MMSNVMDGKWEVGSEKGICRTLAYILNDGHVSSSAHSHILLMHTLFESYHCLITCIRKDNTY
jgi:hypothetical protein